MFTATIPQFVSARTPDELQTEMLNIQLKYSMLFKFYDIQFVKNRWYAWFDLPLSRKEK